MPPRNRRQYDAQMRTYRGEIRDVRETASKYSADTLALLMFAVMVVVLAMMGNGLAIALGGPFLATPFIYYYLKTGKEPDEMVREMTTAPGEGSMFDTSQRRR